MLALLLALVLVVGCLPVRAQEIWSPVAGGPNRQNSLVYTISGVEYWISKKTLDVCLVKSDTTGTIKMPSKIGNTVVKYISFYGFSNIEASDIFLPDTLEEIDGYALSGLKNVKNITIPKNVKKLGDSVFGNTKIGGNVYALPCEKLEWVSLPVSIQELGEHTKYTDSSGKIFLEHTYGTFEYCGRPLDVYYAGTEAQWKKIKYSDHIASDITVHFGMTGPGDKPPVPPTPYPGTSFIDVPQNAYYGEAVKWAVDNSITSGIDNTHFGPNTACTRAQAVTFLWRAAGSPEPQNANAGFTDVKAGDYYEKAVRWAVENGVTSGTGDGKFSPNSTCTRAQIVTFQYRAAGSPSVGTAGSFGDVNSGAYYAEAVAWAVQNDITSGTGGGNFSPSNKCTRAQIVTFLYRDAQ